MSGEDFGIQRIRAEEVGGAEDGQQYEGMMLTGRPHAVLIVDAQGRPHAMAPSRRITEMTVLLDVLEAAVAALRRSVQAGQS